MVIVPQSKKNTYVKDHKTTKLYIEQNGMLDVNQQSKYNILNILGFKRDGEFMVSSVYIFLILINIFNVHESQQFHSNWCIL